MAQPFQFVAKMNLLLYGCNLLIYFDTNFQQSNFESVVEQEFFSMKSQLIDLI